MRIVFLNPIAAMGGGERSLLDLMASLRMTEPALEIHLITCMDGPLVDAARSMNVPVQTVSMPPILAQAGDSRLRNARWRRELDVLAGFLGAGLAARRYARTLRDAIQQHRPDVIHSNGIKCHLLSGLARVPDTPLVWHVRDFIAARPLVGRMLRYAAASGTAVIANSRAVANDVRATLARKAGIVPVEVVYNGIDTDAFCPGAGDAERLDALANMPPPTTTTVRVGIVAAFARWKGQDLFLDAARRVIETQPSIPIRFYIVGGPIYQTGGSQFREDELRELAHQLGIAAHVGFIPFQLNPADAYRALDVVVHASTQPEPFGRTIVEAMSCGRAVIVCAEGGATELFTDGHDAIGFVPRNADALAVSIIRLAEDPDLRARLGTSARQTAVARFDRKLMGPQVLRIYCDLA